MKSDRELLELAAKTPTQPPYQPHIFMQQEIDELRAENVRVKAANLDCMDHFNALRDDYQKSEDDLIKHRELLLVHLAKFEELTAQIKSDEALMQRAMELIADVFGEEKLDVPTLNMLRTRLEKAK